MRDIYYKENIKTTFGQQRASKQGIFHVDFRELKKKYFQIFLIGKEKCTICLLTKKILPSAYFSAK